AGADTINFKIANVNTDQAFENVTALGNTNAALIANSIVSVNGISISAAGAANVADGGTVEQAIAGAVGNATGAGLANGDHLGFVLYDGSGNAYLYAAQITSTLGLLDLNSNGFSVEAVGVVH